MKDIVKAIEAEQEYLKEKIKGTHPNIHDYLDTWGYSDLEEFYLDKRDYLFLNQDWTIIKQYPIYDRSVLEDYANRQKPLFTYMIESEENHAYVRHSCNEEYRNILKENGFRVIDFGYNTSNGLILSYSGDFRFVVMFKNNIDLNVGYMLNKINGCFLEVGLNSLVSNNDILIDGKKVCGSAESNMGDIYMMLFQITFTNHIDEIVRLCGEREKQPSFVDNNVITAEQLKNKVIRWLQ